MELSGDENTGAVASPAAASSTGARTPAVAALVVGVAGLTTAGVFWGLRVGTVNDLEDQCVDGHCPASLESTADRGKAFTVVSAAGLAVGVVGLGAFTWLMLRGRQAAPVAAAAKTARIRLGMGPAGGAVRGVF
jgi:hypothetical protein